MPDIAGNNNLFGWAEIKRSLLVCIWFMFLTFPIMVIQVNTIYRTVEWRWERMFFVGIGAFFLSFLWRYMIRRKEAGIKQAEIAESASLTLSQKLLTNPRFSRPALVGAAIFFIAFPMLFSSPSCGAI